MVPSWIVASWFALFALDAAFFRGRAPRDEWQDRELLEALLASGFLAFLVADLARLRRGEAGVAGGPDQPREDR